MTSSPKFLTLLENDMSKELELDVGESHIPLIVGRSLALKGIMKRKLGGSGRGNNFYILRS